jgi:hypothetical protein
MAEDGTTHEEKPGNYEKILFFTSGQGDLAGPDHFFHAQRG